MAQYDQLIIFYNQLLNMADEIHELVNKEMYDLILDKLSYHDKLLIQVKLAKKCAQLTDKEQEEINRLEDELREKEKENIELLKTSMTAVKLELDRIKLKSKVKKAYGQIYQHQEQGSIIDVDDSYRPTDTQT